MRAMSQNRCGCTISEKNRVLERRTKGKIRKGQKGKNKSTKTAPQMPSGHGKTRAFLFRFVDFKGNPFPQKGKTEATHWATGNTTGSCPMQTNSLPPGASSRSRVSGPGYCTHGGAAPQPRLWGSSAGPQAENRELQFQSQSPNSRGERTKTRAALP